MSRRTAPVFAATPSHATPTTYNPYRHDDPRLLSPRPSVKDATAHLFDALDEARFDQVRRAVAADPTCLRASRDHLSRTVGPLPPVAYALRNCQLWHALVSHCQRSGMAVAAIGHRTFRERLVVMDAVLVWLLQQPCVALPPHPLHIALSCRLDAFALALLQRSPSFALSRDPRGKTAMHVACSLPPSRPASATAHTLDALARAGARADIRDKHGLTPMHELVRAVAGASSSSHGLLHLRRRSHTRMDTVSPIVDALLRHGARLDVCDNAGRSALDAAMDAGLDYTALIARADLLRARLCADSLAHKWAAAPAPSASGWWGRIPDDVAVKILGHLSPRDVVSGIGATCRALRRISTRPCLWHHLDARVCLHALRASQHQRVRSGLPAL